MTTRAVAATDDSSRRRGLRRFAAGLRTDRSRALLARYGALVAIFGTFAAFSLLSPNAFFTVLTMKSILRDCVPLMIVALGITVVLVMNDYDLSVGGLISLCATLVVVFMSTSWVGLNYVVAIALTLLVGTALGLANGVLIAYVRLPSFILTIAMGTVFAGIGLQAVGSQSVFTGITPSFGRLGTGSFLGFSNLVYVGLVVIVVVHVLLRNTQVGRYMYAIGNNAEAARLSGLRVQLLKASGFGIVGLTAAISGIFLSSEAGASNPSTGIGLLLPAYAAAFLGASIYRVGRFTALGTAVGALYLQIVGTGLTILNLSGPVVQIIQGGILATAVLIARLARQGQA